MKNHLTRMSGAALFMSLFLFAQVASGASGTASPPGQDITAAQVAAPVASKATAERGSGAPALTMWLHMLDTNEHTEMSPPKKNGPS
jgi:hypothetical protein